MKNILTSLFTLFMIIQLNSQNTWLGGDGYWHDASRWSYGTVPTVSEGVEITNGTVKIISSVSAYANRIKVSTGARLLVNPGARLLVNASTSTEVHGMMISGYLEVGGKMAVQNVGYGDGINLGGNGVFLITTSGRASIYNTDTNGIWSNATINNKGNLYISNTGNHGIYGFGVIENDSNGAITIANTGAVGIACWNDSQLLNEGEITIEETGSWGIYLREDSYMSNNTGAEITIAHTTSAIKVEAADNTAENFGAISIAYTGYSYGIHNYDTFINHEEGTIIIDHANYGIVNYGDAAFGNAGTITIGDDMIYGSLYNTGDFINHVCGIITTEEKVRNYSQGVLINEGNWYNESTSSSLNYGQFINDGLIEDAPNTFPASIANNEVISKPITGTVQVGIPVSNALDVGNITKHTVNGWYTTESLTQTAGPYDEALNEWTPHTSTVGLTEVFVSLTSNYGNCNSVIRVPVPAGVTPLNAPEVFGGVDTGSETGEFVAYPNPFEQALQLKVEGGFNGTGYVQLYNTLGEIVYHQRVALEAGMIIPIQVRSHLPAGAYMLKISKGESVVWSTRLVKLP
jgi:hypothetical protein